MAGDPLQLPLFSKSTFGDAVSGRHVACNPAVDLVATVHHAHVLSIWRAGGQLVSKHTERHKTVEALRWKPDGQFLAVGWSDGVVRLLGLENTRAVHHIRVSGPPSPSQISHIAWARNHVGRRQLKRPSAAADALRGKLLSGGLELGKGRDVLDLPHEVTFFEIDTALPKISPLPVSGGSGDDMFVFSTRASLNFVFRPIHPEDTTSVAVMMVGTEDGQIHLSIYDSFAVGSLRPRLSKRESAPATLQLRGHASHAHLSTHALLLSPQREPDPQAMYLMPIDLHFVYSWPVNLSLLASKTTTLQNLIRYLKQTQVHMVGEWRSTRELPGKYLNGIREDLQKSPQGATTIVQALYHTVVTGHIFPPVREWLVDVVAERGHKRWDKAVRSGLENLRALVHENMMPALERSAILLSRLLGIARYQGSEDNIGFTAAQITKLLDVVACLTLVCHKILLGVMEELELFSTFSSWLRLQIDALASSSLAEELSEKEATMDHARVLTYVQRYLVESPLALYLDDTTAGTPHDKGDGEEEYARAARQAEDGPKLLEVLDAQMRRKERGQPFVRALPRLGFLVRYLGDQANAVFGAIAETQKRRVLFGRETELRTGRRISRYDMRLCAQGRSSGEGPDGVVFTALGSDEATSEVHLFRTAIEIINGVSSTISTSAAGVSLGGGQVLDFKFLDDASLLVLWASQNASASPILVNIPFQSLSYTAYEPSRGAPEPVRVEGDDVTSVFSTARFGNADGFAAAQMQVVEASRIRGDIPARVCLLGRDQVTCRVYALPEKWEPRMELPGQEEDISMG
ncbi:hypothetical protein VTK73DRAFT_353 [Phialemonium thermophilum]|uniref:Anaphase-promoting complex subunit 4 n=1 Tax=Phialemonium thermophilum TaxID=223376 RepID=A0ABR3VVM3_9PEZI